MAGSTLRLTKEATGFGKRVRAGNPMPLGATWDGKGVNVSIFSDNAERIELCLFDEKGERETARISLPEYTNQKWHGYFPDLRPGQLSGFAPTVRTTPRMAIASTTISSCWTPMPNGSWGDSSGMKRSMAMSSAMRTPICLSNSRDSAPFMPKCAIADTAHTWGGEKPLRVPWAETIIYEAHVRGLTKLHPRVPENLRGTYGALTVPAVLDYLRDLGVTAIEFLPVQGFLDEAPIAARGLVNYWGYNTIAFFAPEARYFGDGEIGEFKTMVKTLHKARIEVILDVVYNHTAEGNELGPTLSFRGIDNASYYRLKPDDKRHYIDFTGCGNSFNLHHPRVLLLVMDSLRYWVQQMHVDGFRFDLATTTTRELDGRFDPFSGFLDAIQQDPVLSRVKLIAEPWDIGPDGYQLGNFPPDWAEWNDRYRDTIRRFWKGDDGVIGELALRITGSSDIFDNKGRRTWASINFITAHDGFTLRDVVSCNEKHNDANDEDNRDGIDQNHSWNCGAEGPSNDPAILALRARQQRNMLATLFLSRGTPMLLAGDEVSQTQRGNNNAYCQDNEISWIDWRKLKTEAVKLHDFVRMLIKLRRQHVVFPRTRFFHGKPTPGTNIKDITWLRPDGREKEQQDWELPYARCLSFVLSGEAGQYHVNAAGEPEVDDTFLVIMNAYHETVNHRMPSFDTTSFWDLVFDTSVADGLDAGGHRYQPGATYAVTPRSFVLLVRRNSAAIKGLGWMPRRRRHRMPFGAETNDEGGTRFRLWAPAADTVDLNHRIGARARPAADDAPRGWMV